MTPLKTLNNDVKNYKVLFLAFIVITIGCIHFFNTVWLNFALSNYQLININLPITYYLILLTAYTGEVYGSAIVIITGLVVIIKWQNQKLAIKLAMIGTFLSYISLNIIFLNFVSYRPFT